MGLPAWPAAVFLAAVCAGLVFVLPDLLIIQHRNFYRRHFPEAVAQWPLGGRYTSIAPYDDPDANSYAARGHEAARHFWPMDPNVKENSSRRLALTDTLSFMFLGATERLTGDVSRGWLLARGLCGMAWLLCLYCLVNAISGRRRMSLAFAAWLTLFYELFADLLWPLVQWPRLGFGVIPPAFRHMAIHAFWLLGNYQCNFGAARVVSPALNHPPFFLAAYAAWGAARGAWGWAWAGGLVGGALAYVHADVWHVYMAAMGVFCAAWSLQQKKPAWALLASFAVSLALSLPWLLANYPMDPEILSRAGGTFTHAVDPLGLVFAAAVAACWPRRREPAVCFAACVFAACILAVESQVLTGYTVDSMRFNYIGVVVALVTAAGIWGRRAAESRHWLWLTAAFFILGGGRAISYASQRFPYQGLPRDLESAFDFLNQQTPNDSVVVSLAANETMLIPVYTHDKTMIGSGYNMTCDISFYEMFRRIDRAARLCGVDERALLSHLNAPEWQHPQGLERWSTALWSHQVDWQAREWKNFFHFYAQTIPRSEFVARLGILTMSRNLPELKADADYLWVGPFERGLMTPRALKALGRPVYENATVSIYKVKA